MKTDGRLGRFTPVSVAARSTPCRAAHNYNLRLILGYL
jgi:hypothetical protein